MNLNDCKAFQYKKESSNTEPERIYKNVTWKFSLKINFSADRVSILTFCEHLKFCVSNSPSAKHHLSCKQRCLRPHLGLGFPSAMSLDLAGKLVSHPRRKQAIQEVFPKTSQNYPEMQQVRARAEQHTRYWVVHLIGHLARICQTQVYIHILSDLEQRREIWSPATQTDVLSWHCARKTAGACSSPSARAQPPGTETLPKVSLKPTLFLIDNWILTDQFLPSPPPKRKM